MYFFLFWTYCQNYHHFSIFLFSTLYSEFVSISSFWLFSPSSQVISVWLMDSQHSIFTVLIHIFIVMFIQISNMAISSTFTYYSITFKPLCSVMIHFDFIYCFVAFILGTFWMHSAVSLVFIQYLVFYFCSFYFHSYSYSDPISNSDHHHYHNSISFMCFFAAFFSYHFYHAYHYYRIDLVFCHLFDADY